MSSGSDYAPQYTHAVPFLYHADAELERVQNGLTIGAVVILGIAAVLLLSLTPDEDRGRRRTAKIALTIAIVGIGANVALRFMTDESWDTGWKLQLASALFLTQTASFFLAAPLALTAFFRRQGKLAGAAVASSLVLPLLFVAWVLACGITDACFH